MSTFTATFFLSSKTHVRCSPSVHPVLYVEPDGQHQPGYITFQIDAKLSVDEQLQIAERFAAGVASWRDGIAARAEQERTAADELATARTELIALLECVIPLDRARTMVDLHHAEVAAYVREQVRAEDLREAARLAAAVQALGALPMPTGGVQPAPPRTCRCNEPGADPYACEADDCTAEFSELNPFGTGARPVNVASAEVSRTCSACGWCTSVWHVDDGSAEAELHDHVARAHPPEDNRRTKSVATPRDLPELPAQRDQRGQA